MVLIKRFYIIKAARKEIIVSLNGLCIGPMPLIWYNNGLYGIICREKIENMIELLHDKENLSHLNPNTNLGMFYWDETEKLDPKIGKLLIT